MTLIAPWADGATAAVLLMLPGQQVMQSVEAAT